MTTLDTPRRRDTAYRWVLVVLLAGAGGLHFVRPEPFAAIVPPPLGDPAPWVWASGVTELVAAGLLAVDRTRRLGGWVAAVTFVAVFPANVQMALDGGMAGARFPLGDPVVAWLRLPLQAVLVWMAWRQTRHYDARSVRRDAVRPQ
jgi:uncharacterized membrane protein